MLIYVLLIEFKYAIGKAGSQSAKTGGQESQSQTPAATETRLFGLLIQSLDREAFGQPRSSREIRQG